MRILEQVQPFCATFKYWDFLIFFLLLRENPWKKSQNSNEVKNGCTRSRIRIASRLRLPILRLWCFTSACTFGTKFIFVQKWNVWNYPSFSFKSINLSVSTNWSSCLLASLHFNKDWFSNSFKILAAKWGNLTDR